MQVPVQIKNKPPKLPAKDSAGNNMHGEQKDNYKMFGSGQTEDHSHYFSGANSNSEKSNSGKTQQVSHNFSNIAVHPMPFIQKKLSVNTPGDEYEQEADAVADKIMRMPATEVLQPKASPINIVQLKAPALRKKETGNEEGETVEEQTELTGQIVQRKDSAPQSPAVPSTVNETLQSTGRPLDNTTRVFMETRFGFNFSDVQIYDDQQAHRSASDISALAYTHQNKIVFGAGQYKPQTEGGKRLLAHELTHVIQQNRNYTTPSELVQRDPLKPASTKMSFPFYVQISSPLSSDELLIEFIKQYHGNISNEDAKKFLVSENWHWVGTVPVVKDEDVKKKYKLVTVSVNGLTPIDARDEKAQKAAFGALPKNQQRDINTQTNKDFWDKTKYKPGKELGDSEDDKKMAKTWMEFRDRLVQEKGIIDKMPELMKNIIANPENYTAKDYAQLSRIISKLNNLSAEELTDYIKKVTATTSDLSVMEDSVDRYLADLAIHKQEDTARDIIKTRLFGTEALYDRYKEWLLQKEGASALTRTRGATGQLAKNAWDRANSMEASLTADLITAGFKGGIPDFVKMIHDFEAAFELESQRIGYDILDKYAHILYEAEQKYTNDAAVDALYQAVSKTTAKADYTEADQIRSDHAQIPWTPDEMAEQSYWVGKRNEALERGRRQVLTIAADNPLVNTSKFDLEALAKTSSKDEVKKLIFDYIAARRDDITTSRESLRDNPELVYKTEILKHAYQKQNIQAGSIFDKIIQDKINKITLDEILLKALIAVLAIALGLISMGQGTIAVLAAAGAFGISAYQAVEEYRDYEMKKGLAGADLLSEDPSLFWVIAAVVGAGLDLGMVASSIKTLTPAITVFNEGHDVAKFEKALAELADIDSKLKTNLAAAARNEAKYQESVSEFRKVGGRAYSFAGIPDPEAVWKLGKVAYAALKKGINTFDKFLLELKAQKIIDNIDGLSAEQKLLFKQAWLDALAEDTRLSKIQSIGDKIPINAQDFAGRTFSFDVAQNPVAKARMAEKYTGTELADKMKAFDDLAKKYPNGVKFTDKGFPDFSPYTVTLPNGNVAKCPIKTAGNRSADFAAADKWADITEEYRQTNELVWHHVEDGKTMILVPRDVHGTVKHSGGISVFTNTVIEE